MKKIKFIECPRDAMQGIHEFIPTDKKVSYLEKLLKCQFDTIDCGSFVSEKAIPQLKDTKDVLEKIDMSETLSKLLVIVANLRGAKEAVLQEKITFIGFPFSISETFQKRNTNSSIEESFNNLYEIQNECIKHNKKLVIYLSMGFGNPYGDLWNEEIVFNWISKLEDKLSVKIISLSDTIGCASEEQILSLFPKTIDLYKDVEIGAHLHVTPEKAIPIFKAVLNSGCARLDSAIKGFGGCPMASDSLTGNMPTEKILEYLNTNKIKHNIDMSSFYDALEFSNHIFL